MTTTINIPLHLPENLQLTPDQLKLELATYFYKEYNLTPQQAGKMVGFSEADCEFLRMHLFEPEIFRTKEWVTKAGSEMSSLLQAYQEWMATKEVTKQFQAICQIVDRICFELETSLSFIAAPFEFMPEDTWDPMSEAGRRFLLYTPSYLRGAKRNLAMLRDILNIETGKLDLTFSAVGVAEIIKAVSTELDKVKETVKFVYEIPDGVPDIWVDKEKIQQALLNFILNATVIGSKLSVHIAVDHDGSQWVRVVITDNGGGIPVDYIEHFCRKPASLGGSIGRLEIALGEYVIEKQRGNIKFEHQPGIGTTITTQLPIYQNAS